MDILHYAGLALTGFGAGLLGALLGLGGGIFVVPALVLGLDVPQIVAVGASNVAVVATSTAGASSYIGQRLTNIRLGLVLLTSTTTAAVISSLVARHLPAQVLSGLFAVVLVYAAISMMRGQRAKVNNAPAGAVESRSASALGLEGSYYDAATGQVEHYRPGDIRAGWGLSAVAGVLAGLLGVGGGIVQVPVMNLLMGVPLKVAAATSNYMIGITATSAAVVRYISGDIDPLIAVPITLCVFVGARLGAWLVPRTPTARLRQIFGPIAIVIAVLMVLQALGIYHAPGR
jgi:uncharacterized protein